MKKLLICALLLFTSSLLAATFNLEKLSSKDQSRFNNLPKNVQTLMKNEAQFLQKIEKLKIKKILKLNTKNDHCDDDDDDDDTNSNSKYNCVPNCTWRSSDGSCNSYGDDFCGVNAVCVENCSWRSSDGSCNSYDPDICY